MKIQHKASSLFLLLAITSLNSFASAGNLDLRDAGNDSEFASGLGDLLGEENSSISVTLQNGSEKTFTKTRNPNAGTSSIGWSGQSSDGSNLTILFTIDGYTAGSLVDMERDEITQWSTSGPNMDKIVTVTPSSDFPPELHPVDEDGAQARPLVAVDEHAGTATAHSFGNYTTDAISNIADLKAQANYQQEGRKLADDGSVADIMVLWTKKAECKKSNRSGNCALDTTTFNTMKAHIELAVTETNDAYIASGVETQLRLVHSYREENYVETSFSDSLSHLSDKSDGYMDDVHARRTFYAADLVALVIHNTNYCGLAYAGPRRDLMFSVTAWNCATGHYSFAHEIGRNQGCLPDRGTMNACSQPGYNFGFRDPQAGFRSILAYDCVSDQCDDNPGGGCTRAKMFSNPDYPFNGKPIGDPRNDNRGQINAVRVQIARYYTSKPPPCEDATTTFIYRKKKRDCQWIRDSNPASCNNYKIKLMCPRTCETCHYKFGDSTYNFLPYYPNNATKTSCSKLSGEYVEYQKEKCALPNFYQTCCATCKAFVGELTILNFDESCNDDITEYKRSDLQLSDWWSLNGEIDQPDSGYEYGTVSDPLVGLNGWGKPATIECPGGSFTLHSLFMTPAGRNNLLVTLEGYKNDIQKASFSVTLFSTTQTTFFDSQLSAFADIDYLKISANKHEKGYQIAFDDMAIEIISPCAVMNLDSLGEDESADGAGAAADDPSM